MSSNVNDSDPSSPRPSMCQSAGASNRIADQNTVSDVDDYMNIDSRPLVGQQNKSSSITASTVRPARSYNNNHTNKKNAMQTLTDTDPLLFQQNNDGDTQLHIAISRNQLRLSLWLIGNAGQPSNLDLVNKAGFTALHIAVITRQTDIIRKLVLAGANTEIIAPSTGYTALHYACNESDVDSVKALTEPPNDEEKGLTTIPTSLETTDHEGYTALHIAATHDNVDVIKQLISVGANLNAVERRFGRMPFHMAIENNCRKVIEYLVGNSSCINVLTTQGMSSYEIALNVDNQLAENLLHLGALPLVRNPEFYDSIDDIHKTCSNEYDFANDSDDVSIEP